MSRMIFIALNASDLARSIAFYREAFAIELHTDTNEPVDDTWYGGEHAAFSWTDGAFAEPPGSPLQRNRADSSLFACRGERGLSHEEEQPHQA